MRGRHNNQNKTKNDNRSPTPRRRRFSAEEIRRQPEFRAIVASTTQDTDTHNAIDIISAANRHSNIVSIKTPNESNVKAFRSRSHSVPGIDSQHLMNVACDQFLYPTVWGLNPGTRPESSALKPPCKHDHPAHKNAHGENQKEPSSVIVKNDKDMGILVTKQQSTHQPQKTCLDSEEKTDSHLICQKIILKKKHFKNPHDKNKNEMSTLYEEPFSENNEGDNTVPQIEIKSNAIDVIISTDTDDSEHSLNTDQGNGIIYDDHYLRPIQSAPGRTHSLTDDEDDREKQSPESMVHRSFHTQARKIVNAIRFQTSIREKCSESEELEMSRSNLPLTQQANENSYRKYDAKLEKSAVYLRSRNRTFTRATQFMEAPKSGIRQLNVHYSQTNSCHNDRIIFTDLLKTSHIQNSVVADGVYAMERRLYNRRHEKGKNTTFYDRFASTLNTPRKQRPQSSPLPHRTASKSSGRTVADKKKERKERIQKKEDLIELGYVPRMATLETKGPEVIEDILMSCRHLRVTPAKQPWLYVDDKEL